MMRWVWLTVRSIVRDQNRPDIDVSDEQLERFFESNLTGDQRVSLLGKSKKEMMRALRKMYQLDQMGSDRRKPWKRDHRPRIHRDRSERDVRTHD